MRTNMRHSFQRLQLALQTHAERVTEYKNGNRTLARSSFAPNESVQNGVSCPAGTLDCAGTIRAGSTYSYVIRR